MSTLNLYATDVVDIAITADMLDRTFSSTEQLYYHHTTATRDWDDVFGSVVYEALDQAASSTNAQGAGDADHGGAPTTGTLKRYQHKSGSVDITAGSAGLADEVKQAVNYYMMTKEADISSVNLSSSTLEAIDGGFSGEYADYKTWATMVSGKETANVTANEVENIIEALGSDGKLKDTATGLALTSGNIASGQNVNLYVVYKITIAETDSEEDHVQPVRTFDFQAGCDASGDASATPPTAGKGPGEVGAGNDASGAPAAGEAGTIRFRTQYTATGTATL